MAYPARPPLGGPYRVWTMVPGMPLPAGAMDPRATLPAASISFVGSDRPGQPPLPPPPCSWGRHPAPESPHLQQKQRPSIPNR